MADHDMGMSQWNFLSKARIPEGTSIGIRSIKIFSKLCSLQWHMFTDDGMVQYTDPSRYK